ncbi:D-alanyl-D-alanine carboxypeptidase family protein [Anaerosphaera multitolerans]|uniref:serine-type D-Ala-D-Ala carboxypeptidase n=1 Tax=Anaerosphaera multitolerans TaxID=2487351 RepID=A0A437S8R7_9FIRM|nr:D-alanyl-D-alanine carboxypeptidase family protein [Anaerosphaera multitolerans]RVU55495.1 D-alanyl-D-alanine carboxypeptidase [Anaerosphaera multitolerans]
MKKTLSIFLAVLMLLFPASGFANSQTSENGDKEIRNQNIFVPTKDGVQRATYEEALKIEELNQKSLMDLCESYLLGDYKSGRILESYNIDEIRPIASMSKLVSLFVVMDKIKDGTISKDESVTIDSESASLSGSSFKLKENDEFPLWDLVKASVVVSGNDAITALAKHISGSQEAFVGLMNEKCRELGLENAKMINPTGLTDYSSTVEDKSSKGEYNEMTTRELFILTREIIRQYPELLEISSMDKLEDEERDFSEYNTNPILGIVEGVDGLKTGYTNASGRCLVATGQRKGVEGVSLDTRLIGITTGSRGDWERYVAAKRLLSDGFEKYKYVVVGNLDRSVTTVKVENASEVDVEVFEKDTGSVLWDGESEIKKQITIKPNLKAPIPAGEAVGSITYRMNGEQILTSDLIVKEKVNERGIFFKLRSLYEDIFTNIKNAI